MSDDFTATVEDVLNLSRHKRSEFDKGVIDGLRLALWMHKQDARTQLLINRGVALSLPKEPGA